MKTCIFNGGDQTFGGSGKHDLWSFNLLPTAREATKWSIRIFIFGKRIKNWVLFVWEPTQIYQSSQNYALCLFDLIPTAKKGESNL